MPAANPIVSGGPASQASIQSAGPAPTAPAATSGMGRLSGAIPGQKIPVHVAGLVLASLVVVILLHLGGFRFVFDASVGRR